VPNVPGTIVKPSVEQFKYYGIGEVLVTVDGVYNILEGHFLLPRTTACDTTLAAGNATRHKWNFRRGLMRQLMQ
jgi:hypothetical protein